MGMLTRKRQEVQSLQDTLLARNTEITRLNKEIAKLRSEYQTALAARDQQNADLRNELAAMTKRHDALVDKVLNSVDNVGQFSEAS